MKYFSIIVLSLVAIISCEKQQSQAEIDDEIINNYLSDNSLEAEYHSSGLYYHIVEPGSGGNPDLSSTVEVMFRGYLTNNQVFDETDDGTIEFPLSNLIKGWQIGIPLLQKGGKGILYLPSALGYGSYSDRSIPANSVLIFEIDLVDFY